MSADRLEHSRYPREGFKLEAGALWEVSVEHSLRDLVVLASADGIRIRDTFCGEWEMAEQSAVHLDADEARQLGEMLLAAADATESRRGVWSVNAVRVNPRPELERVRRERDNDPEVRALRRAMAGTEVTE